jgi:hypothetical protein
MENGVSLGVATDPAKARDVLGRALSTGFKTEQNNLRMTGSRSATVSEAPTQSQNKQQKTI